jgi:PAS domain S-box-containing protein
MKLKSRITLTLGAMTLLIIALAAASTYFLARLGDASENILKDNFRSVENVNIMIDALDEMDNSITRDLLTGGTRHQYELQRFQSYDSLFHAKLTDAEANITEPGEREILIALRKKYQEFIIVCRSEGNQPPSYLSRIPPVYDSLKARCIDLLRINTLGMNIRNNKAKAVSEQAALYVVVLAGSVIFIALVMLVGIPARIIHPLNELAAKIESVTKKKYSERITIHSHDEIGELARRFNTMAEKLEEYERSNIDALISEKKRSEAIVKSMSDGVIVLGQDLTIMVVNQVASELLGVSDEVIGRNAEDIGKVNNLVAHLIENIDSTEPKDTTLRIYHDGKEEYYLRDIIQVRRTSGDPTSTLGYIIELKNISEFKALDEAKSGFVTTVSHELRTPLSALNMSLRLLQDNRIGQLNPEQVKIIDAMKQEIKRLLRIVAELLELSRAEVGAEVMHIRPVIPESIIDAAVTPMMLQADQKNIELEIRMPQELPFVYADSSKIAWVLINLLSNAIRYTPSGGHVTLEIMKKDNTVEFSVADTGIGIEPENLNRIFDKFYQVRSRTTDQHTGVGLGLAISKEIIETHGSKIFVESEVGKGSTFRFSLRAAL